MLQSSSSIESRVSWVVASVALVVMLMAFGAAWITAGAIKDIAAEGGGTAPHTAASTPVAAGDRPRTFHRTARPRWHQRADVHLCQPLVRPATRLGAGADLEWQLSRRRDVAASVPGRGPGGWVGAGPALFRARPG